jgi:hypothetical protein
VGNHDGFCRFGILKSLTSTVHIILNQTITIVGAAEGCDVSILKIQSKRSQPSAALTIFRLDAGLANASAPNIHTERGE